MSYSLIAHTAAGNAATVVTSGIDTTGADFIVVSISHYTPSGAATLSDSKGNTWTPLTDRAQAAVSAQIFYCENPVVGSGHTFQYSGGGNYYPSIFVSAWSGSKASSAFDAENGATAASGPLSTGSITPAEDNELIITALGCNNFPSTAITVNGGFTVTDTIETVAGVHFGGGMAYLVQTSASSANPQWSWVYDQGAVAVACFKQAPGASFKDPTIMALLGGIGNV